MANLDWLTRRSVAHRGLHDAANGIVENTPTAIQAALDAGYAIEADVQEAGDGEPMVFHDPTLDRLTQATGPVINHTSMELKRIAFKGVPDRMQLLPELLERISGRVPLIIEIKSNWRARGPFEARIASILKKYRGHVAVMSFDHKVIAAIAHHAPDVTRGLIAGPFRNPQFWGHLSPAKRFIMRHLLSTFIARPHFIAYDIDGLPACAPYIWRRILKRPLLTWVVRCEADRQRAEKWADAMIFEGYRP